MTFGRLPFREGRMEEKKKKKKTMNEREENHNNNDQHKWIISLSFIWMNTSKAKKKNPSEGKKIWKMKMFPDHHGMVAAEGRPESAWSRDISGVPVPRDGMAGPRSGDGVLLSSRKLWNQRRISFFSAEDGMMMVRKMMMMMMDFQQRQRRGKDLGTVPGAMREDHHRCWWYHGLPGAAWRSGWRNERKDEWMDRWMDG